MAPDSETTAEAPSTPPEPGVPLRLPRPNLGPEPWRGSTGPLAEIVAGSVVALIVAFGLLIWLRRRRRLKASRPRPGADLEGSAADLSPEARLVAQAEAIREALIAAFGPAWAARTTEEVAATPDLAEKIGPDRAARVVALLAEADRAKFAGGLPDGAQPEEDAGGWVPEVVEALAAGASSTITGR